MTRSTLNLTVLDSGLQQEVCKVPWQIGEMKMLMNRRYRQQENMVCPANKQVTDGGTQTSTQRVQSAAPAPGLLCCHPPALAHNDCVSLCHSEAGRHVHRYICMPLLVPGSRGHKGEAQL